MTNGICLCDDKVRLHDTSWTQLAASSHRAASQLFNAKSMGKLDKKKGEAWMLCLDQKK